MTAIFSKQIIKIANKERNKKYFEKNSKKVNAKRRERTKNINEILTRLQELKISNVSDLDNFISELTASTNPDTNTACNKEKNPNPNADRQEPKQTASTNPDTNTACKNPKSKTAHLEITDSDSDSLNKIIESNKNKRTVYFIPTYENLKLYFKSMKPYRSIKNTNQTRSDKLRQFNSLPFWIRLHNHSLESNLSKHIGFFRDIDTMSNYSDSRNLSDDFNEEAIKTHIEIKADKKLLKKLVLDPECIVYSNLSKRIKLTLKEIEKIWLIKLQIQ